MLIFDMALKTHSKILISVVVIILIFLGTLAWQHHSNKNTYEVDTWMCGVSAGMGDCDIRHVYINKNGSVEQIMLSDQQSKQITQYLQQQSHDTKYRVTLDKNGKITEVSKSN